MINRNTYWVVGTNDMFKPSEITTLKVGKGHQIKMVKGNRQGYKYLGIYSKPIKTEGKTMTEQEVVKPDEETSEETKEEPKEESELDEETK